MAGKDIYVALVSRDPFFLFAARALLGRDRRARIFDTVPTIKALRDALAETFQPIDVIICDLDSYDGNEQFFDDLCRMVNDMPDARVLCLAQAHLEKVVSHLENTPIRGLLVKQDLSYCIHLAVKAVTDDGVTLLTKRIRPYLTAGSVLQRHGRFIDRERRHPELTARIEEIVMWRMFIGLDNPDIQDELLLGDDTIRKYVSKGYKALGAGNEFEAFEALSDWWWVTRFSKIIE